jgi:hypothetical protein
MARNACGVLIICFFVHLCADAQPLRGKQALERVQQLRKVRMIELLNLSEEQSVRFFARLNQHENEREALLQAKTSALDKIERLVHNKANQDQFDEIFPELMSLDEKLAGLDKNFFKSLQDIFSPSQQAKFLLFDRQFERELRESIREVYRRRIGSGE